MVRMQLAGLARVTPNSPRVAEWAGPKANPVVRSARKMSTGLACLGLAFSTQFGQAEPTNSVLPTLTRVSEILRLNPEEAARGYPVQIDAVVSHVDVEFGLTFVQDATAGIFLNDPNSQIAPASDRHFRIDGFTGAGLFSPIVRMSKAQVLPAVPMPPARQAEIGQVLDGSLDSQWIEVKGIAQSERESANHLHLELASGENRCDVWITRFAGYQALKLTDSLLRIRGVAGARFDQNKRLAGFQLYVSSLDDVAVLEAPAYRGFDGPVRSSGQLSSYTTAAAGAHRIHVRGTVTMQWPGEFVFIRDGDGGLCLETLDAPLLNAGDQVEAVGFRDPSSWTPRLRAAVVRSLGSSEIVRPTVVSAEAQLKTFHDQELVTLQARLLTATVPSPDHLALTIQRNDLLWHANLRTTNAHTVSAQLLPGSQLELTGVCELNGPRPRQGLGPALWLRSPADLRVLAAGGQGIAPTTAWISSALAVVLLLWGGSVIWLRKRARRETKLALAEADQHLRRNLEERERLGQDLHDNIMQTIYVLGLGLDDCQRLVRKAPEKAEERLSRAIQTINSILADMRQFIGGLEPKVLSGHELKTALKSLALTTGESSSQFLIRVDSGVSDRLTSQQATHLLNIAKEAMTNSLRHSKADQTIVTLCLAQGRVRLEVKDNGVGFDPQQARSNSGNGLRNIAARARALGAQVEVVSKPDHGTCVVVELPPISSYEHASPA